MTEQKWLTRNDPSFMLSFLSKPGRTSYRKMRLYACACCRLIPPLMASNPDRQSVELAEREADGLIPPTAEYPVGTLWDMQWFRREFVGDTPDAAGEGHGGPRLEGVLALPLGHPSPPRATERGTRGSSGTVLGDGLKPPQGYLRQPVPPRHLLPVVAY
jgi:hypothetical protein